MKPTKKTIEYYDYFECCNYLSERKGYKRGDSNNPYDMFWDCITDMSGLNNGTYWYMNKYWFNWFDLVDIKDKTPRQIERDNKIKPILEEFLAEFGEGEDRSIHFKAEW